MLYPVNTAAMANNDLTPKPWEDYVAEFEDPWEKHKQSVLQEQEDEGFVDGAIDTAKDAGLALVSGAIAVPEAAVGLADLATGGHAGKFLENEGGAFGFRPDEAREYLRSLESDGLKQARADFAQADGVWDKTKTALANPDLIGSAVIESLPMVGATVATGGAGAAGTAALGARVATKAPTIAKVLAGTARAMPFVAEGIAGAGSAAAQIRQESEDGLLSGKQMALAGLTGVGTGIFGKLGGKAADALKIGDLEQMGAQYVAKQLGADAVQQVAQSGAQRGLIRRVVYGAISEGLFEELPQSVQEQVLQNLALKKHWSEGVEDAAVMGALSGGVMGGAFNIPNRAAQSEAGANTQDTPALATNQDAAPIDANAPVDNTMQAPATPSQQMGLDPNTGTMSAAAALAVDSGASPQVANGLVQDGKLVIAPTTDGLFRNAMGQPFVDKAQANMAAAQNGRGFDVVQVEGGYALASKSAAQAVAADSEEASNTSIAVRRTGGDSGGGRTGSAGGGQIVLQNRNRATPASISQMNAIAANPDYLRAGQSNTMDTGAPVVFGGAPTSAKMGKVVQVADQTGKRTEAQYAVVEAADVLTSNLADGREVAEYAMGAPGKVRAIAGNGRAAGLAAAYQRGTAAAYKQELQDDAGNLGLEAQDIAAMQAPMLVRIMREQDVEADTADRSNITATARLSPVEEAVNDAARVDLSALEFGENGLPTDAAMRGFIAAMPEAERANMINPDGTPTRQAQDRVMAAAFKQAYDNDSLVQLYAQATDPEARTVVSALAQVAADMAALKDAGGFDIRQAVADAAAVAVNAVRNGVKLADFAQNADLAMNPEALVVARFMAKNIRSSKRIAEGLRNFAQKALEQIRIAQTNTVQQGMFGEQPTVSREQLFKELENDGQETTTSAFEYPSGVEFDGQMAEEANAEQGGVGRSAADSTAGGAAEAGGVESLQVPRVSEAQEQGSRKQNSSPTPADIQSIAYPPPSQQQIEAFIDDALLANDPRGELVLREVNQREIDEVHSQSGLDITGLQHVLDASSLKHALKQHGNDTRKTKGKAKNQENLTAEHLKRIPEILDDFDSLTVESRSQNRSSLIYKKAFDDGTVEYVERVLETSRNKKPRLLSKTVWVTSPTPATNMEGATQQVYTPERSPIVPETQTESQADPAVELADSMRQAIHEALGAERANQMQVVARAEEVDAANYKTLLSFGVSKTAEGFFDPKTGNVVLIAENIHPTVYNGEQTMTAEQHAVWVAWHELTHRALQAQQGSKTGSYGFKLATAYNEARSNGTVKRLADIIAESRRKQDMDITSHVATEEALVELRAALQTGDFTQIKNRYDVSIPLVFHRSIRATLARFAQRIRALVAEITGAKAHEWTDSQVFDALYSLEAFDTAPIQTETALPDEEKLSLTAVDKNLVVMHNLTADSIVNADKIGGLPVPSIAVGRTDIGFESFGDITLIADKSMVDPAVAGNKTYNSDVYSPRYPSVHNDINAKTFDSIFGAANQQASQYGLHTISSGSLGLEHGRAYDLERNEIVKLAYLIEKNKAPRPKHRQSNVPQSLRKYAGQDWQQLARDPQFQQAVYAHYVHQRGAKVAEVLFSGDDAAYKMSADMAQQVAEYTGAKEADYSANKEAIDKKISGKSTQADYRKWVAEKWAQIVDKESIFKGYTPSGNRRYVPHTLDNVVKEIKGNIQGGEKGGVGAVRGSAAKQFKSIAQIQNDRNKIVDAETMRAVKDEIADTYYALKEKLKPYYEYSGYVDDGAIAEYARTGKLTDFKGVPSELKKELDSFVAKAKNAPTEYFEAKPQRAVRLNEFVSAVVPNGTPQNVLNILQNHGVAVKQYNPSIAGDRTKKVELSARQNDVKFSLPPADTALQKDFDATAKKYGGKPEYDKAKAGGNTKLNYRQWVQVRTPAFKQWFGDWENDPANASKVVDDNGEPLVVYHGTAYGGFVEFRDDLRKKVKNEKGFFFSDSYAAALQFASGIDKEINFDGYFSELLDEEGRDNIIQKLEGLEADEEYDTKTKGGTSYTFTKNEYGEIDVYVNDWGVETEITLGDPQEITTYMERESHVYRAFLNIRNPDVYDASNVSLSELSEKTLSVADGVDGHIWENAADKYHHNPYYDIELITATQIVAFHPNQIKSATENTGAFSADSDDIRFSIAPETAQPKRQADTFLSARIAASAFAGKDLINEQTQFVARVSRNSLDKMLSRSAVSKSETPQSHALAVANLDDLFARAIQGWSKPDRDSNQNIRAIHRFFAPIMHGQQMQLVKMTVKETADKPTPNSLYSVEAVELNENTPAVMWVTASLEADGDKLTLTRPSGDVLSLAQAVENFNSGGGGDMLFSVADSPPNRQNKAFDAPQPTKFDDHVYKLQNKFIDLKRVIEAIEKKTGQVADSINAYLKEALYHGRTAERVKDFGREELEPVMQLISNKGLTLSDVHYYLWARHASEANKLIAQRNPDNPKMQDQGSGMSNAAIKAYFAKLSVPQRRRLEEVAKQIDAIIEGTRQLFVDYGLEDQSVVDGWRDMFKYYVPLMREGMDESMGIGQGFNMGGKETQHRTGSHLAVKDILANIALQRERVIARGEKNRVSVALAGLVLQNPNTDFWQVRTEIPKKQTLDEKTNKVIEVHDFGYKTKKNVLTAKMFGANGKVQEVFVEFNEHNARAVRLAGAMKNLDAASLEGLLGASAKITRYFSAINTQYNPVFGPVNLIRDAQSAMLNLAGTPLAGQQAKVLKDTASALAAIFRDMRRARKGEQPKSEWGKWLRQFEEDGGSTGYRELFKTSADRANALKRTLNPKGWLDSGIGKIVTANGMLKAPISGAQTGIEVVGNWLDDYNNAMENATRLAVYKAAIDSKMSREQAALMAKNITVNFNRKGQVAQQMGAMYAFFNAAMQGTARMGQLLFTMEGGDIKTLRLSKAGKAIVYGGVALGVVQALVLAATGFDEDEPPQFVRERSLVIPIGGGQYVTIPMPQGFHILPGIGRHATEWALSGFDKTPQRVVEMLGMFADAFNPIGNSGLSMQTLAPTPLDPMVALLENKDFTGREITRKGRNPAVPGFTQGRDTATVIAKMTAEAINWVSGGNAYKAGSFSPTPDQIDYLIGQATGGVGRELSKAQQTVTSQFTGEALPPHKIPAIGRFYGNTTNQAAQAGRFYNTLDRVNEIETEVKGLREDGHHLEANKVLRQSQYGRVIPSAKAAKRQLRRLRKERRLALERGDAQLVKRYEQHIEQMMRRFNQRAEQMLG